MKNQTFSPSTDPEPRPKRHFWFLFIPTLILFGISLYLILDGNSSLSSKQIPEATGTAAVDGSIESLLYTQLPESLAENNIESWTLDDVTFSDDKSQALLWMAANDDSTGETLARESHLILAIWDASGGKWQLHLEDDPDFAEVFLNSWFKDSEIAERFTVDDSKAATTGNIYGGYYLPWQFGLTKRLTWSVGHTSCASGYCTYAFDFADGTMFELLAAKGGYVYHWRDICTNGNPNCTNSITLEDRTTTPWTYQIYLHIAQNSIPEALKFKGTYVQAGQKIANVDDTGLSSGHHVHFMVVEKGTLNACTVYCWGKSVDITFRDVNINWDPGTQGGRPRLADEAKWYGGVGQTKYTSGNSYLQSPPQSFFLILFPIFR